MKTDLQVALAAATNAAEAAEQLIARYLSSGDWSVQLKPDDSPVTEVDVAAEEVISDILRTALPDAVFFGEETGKSDVTERAGLLWLVDPIDGTKSFIRGMPFYSTQIALAVNQRLSVGVSNAPAFGERLVGVVDQGVWLNDTPVSTRQNIERLEDAFLSSGNLASLASDGQAWQRYGTLVSRVRRVRGYGDFCHYHQLCCGQTDLIIESDVNILDIAALTVCVRAAGGIITDMNGAAIAQNTTSVVAASSPALHDQALNLLSNS
ncbi:MAG: inositol monophosphatase [Granulosicoccus sp.]